MASEPLTPHQRNVLLLLWLATLPAAFVNTVFTQTVAYAATEFDISTSGQGFGAAIVRWGVLIALPFALTADKFGRRRMIVALAWLAPIVTSLGALSPSFSVLVATQAVGRPLGISLSVFVIVFATEEMGNNTRAWALSVLAVASGVGAGSAVAALPLAGISQTSWRYVYLVGLAWLFVAVVLTKKLPETRRYLALQVQQAEESPTHQSAAVHARIRLERLWLQIVVAILLNIFIASASIFQIRYLKDVRGYSASLVAAYSILTAIPASLGLVIGGRLADKNGRKLIAVISVPLGSLLVAGSFAFSGPLMWMSALSGGILLGLSYPAMAVFRNELFPTAHRNFASAIITTASLIGGSAGLIAAGVLLDRGASYASVMLSFALGPVLVSLLVALKYPETAHRKLEDLNPEDVQLQVL
jgi:MFS family permease